MVSQIGHADLEIHILALEAQGYPVKMTLNNQEQYPRKYVVPQSLHLPWVATASAEADGERLFRWLLADARVKTAWAEAPGRFVYAGRGRIASPGAGRLDHGIC